MWYPETGFKVIVIARDVNGKLPLWLNSELRENRILFPQLNTKLLCVDTKSDEW